MGNRRCLRIASRERVRVLALEWSLACIVMATACTSFEPGTDVLDDETADLTSDESMGPGGPWSCVPDSIEATSYLDEGSGARRLVRSVQLLSLVTSAPIPGISVRACAQRDLECADPLTPDLAVGADGWVDVPLYEGFVGYLEVRGETIMPAALVFSAPIVGADTGSGGAFALVESDVLSSLTAAIGAQQSPMLGLVAVRALDCDERDASGIHYEIDEEGVVPWYFVGGLPSGTVSQTADSSLGGFVNVPPGLSVVSAMLTTSQRTIVAPTSVLVRPGWMTVARFIPPQL